MNRSGKQLQFEVIIVGAGQAGLVLGYFLKSAGLNFVILDENQEVGFSWKNRYDSLILFTNVRNDSLAGFKFLGDPNKFPGKDGVANYLKEYAKKFSLPIQLNTKVVRISKDQLGIFHVTTEQKDIYSASNVVICSGLSDIPFVPSLAQNINRDVLQLHSSEYKNSSQLKVGPVLVVGGGNSGVQIAEELVYENKKVYFSFRGNLRSIDIHNPVLQWMDANLLPLFISYKSFLLNLVKKFRERLVINTDIKKLFNAKNIFLVGIIKESTNDKIICTNAELTDVQNIIWATGFRFNFDWIDFDVFDAEGYPIHKRGVTSVPGLFFLGFFWLHWEKITFISGTSKDAHYIAEKIELRTKNIISHSIQFINITKSALLTIGIIALGILASVLLIKLDSFLDIGNFQSMLTVLIGGVILAIGTCLRFWATFLFRQHNAKLLMLKAQKSLFTEGPYKFSRNPLYVGMVSIFLGLALIFGSLSAILFSLAVFIVWNLIIRLVEEKDLENVFGNEYLAYKNEVPRWF